MMLSTLCLHCADAAKQVTVPERVTHSIESVRTFIVPLNSLSMIAILSEGIVNGFSLGLVGMPLHAKMKRKCKISILYQITKELEITNI